MIEFLFAVTLAVGSVIFATISIGDLVEKKKEGVRTSAHDIRSVYNVKTEDDPEKTDNGTEYTAATTRPDAKKTVDEGGMTEVMINAAEIDCLPYTKEYKPGIEENLERYIISRHPGKDENMDQITISTNERHNPRMILLKKSDDGKTYTGKTDDRRLKKILVTLGEVQPVDTGEPLVSEPEPLIPEQKVYKTPVHYETKKDITVAIEKPKKEGYVNKIKRVFGSLFHSKSSSKSLA